MTEQGQEPVEQDQPDDASSQAEETPGAAPLNRAQRRAQMAGKKGQQAATGLPSFGGSQNPANRGSRPAGQAPKQSRASGRGK